MVDKIPLVSITCPAYNHEKYIAKTLDGFVMQQTSFPFEIIVHDDASSDNTAKIIKEYESKFPHLFANIYQTENQFSKSADNIMRITFAASKGKYIALCEGDDYWTDPYKLQKQVSFLETNSEYSVCFHAFHELNDEGIMSVPAVQYNKEPATYSIEDLAYQNLIATPTVVYRNNVRELPAWLSQSPLGDYVLHLLHAAKGKVYFMPDFMAVYRIHAGGIWSHTPSHLNEMKFKWVVDKMDKHFNYEYHKYFYGKHFMNKYHLYQLEYYQKERNFFRYFLTLFLFMRYKKTVQRSYGNFLLLAKQYFTFGKKETVNSIHNY